MTLHRVVSRECQIPEPTGFRAVCRHVGLGNDEEGKNVNFHQSCIILGGQRRCKPRCSSGRSFRRSIRPARQQLSNVKRAQSFSSEASYPLQQSDVAPLTDPWFRYLTHPNRFGVWCGSRWVYPKIQHDTCRTEGWRNHQVRTPYI